MDSTVLSIMSPQLLAAYLRNPQVLEAERLKQEGSDTSPVQHWTQGLARVAKGAMGARLSRKLADQYNQQQREISGERQNAMSLAMGRPAETETYGDTTINWNEQKPNYMGAVSALQSPDNQQLAQSLLGAKINQDQLSAQQAFQQAQQERLFQQQRALSDMQMSRQQAMQDAIMNRQMELEKFKLQSDPTNAILNNFLQQQAQQVPTPQPQQAPQPMMTPIPGMQPSQGVPQGAPQQGTPSLQDVILQGALASKGFKMPEGYMMQGGNIVQNTTPKPSKFDDYMAREDAQTISKARDAQSKVLSFKDSISRARDAFEQVSPLLLGPVSGRISSTAGVTSVNNLDSALNELALRARTLMELPASGFSDPDREFLRQVASTSAMRGPAIKGILERLDSMTNQAIQNNQALIGYGTQNKGLSGFTDPRTMQPPSSGTQSPSSGWKIEVVQ